MTTNVTPSPTPDAVTDINRLLDISNYDIESPELRLKLDGFAKLAAERLQMPAAMISIVLDSAQYAAGQSGLDGSWIAEAEGTPVEWSFCATVVREGHSYVVTDAATDELQHDNPAVTDDGIRSYAGAPIISPAGNVLGACCVAGFEPHLFSPENLQDLSLLATDVVAELAHYRYEDPAA